MMGWVGVEWSGERVDWRQNSMTARLQMLMDKDQRVSTRSRSRTTVHVNPPLAGTKAVSGAVSKSPLAFAFLSDSLCGLC